MKEIIRQYGGFFVEAIVLVSLCFFLFINITDNNGNKGVFAIIGSNIPTVNVDYGTYSDFASFKSEAAKTAPDIEYKRTDQMYTISNLLSDYIGTTTYSGNAAHIKVLSLNDENGNDCLEAYNETDGTITFSNPGIYVIRIKATDDINKKSIVDIEIPVERI